MKTIRLLALVAIAALSALAQIQTINNEPLASARVKINANFTDLDTYKLTDPTTTTGDMIYRGASGTVRLSVGSNGQCLTVSGGIPAWASCPGGGGGTTVWGGISGTLSLQGDLQAALNAKQATLSSYATIVALWTGVPSSSLFMRADGILAAPSVGGIAWGAISGTLTDQSDLNTALAGKASATHASRHNSGGADPLTSIKFYDWWTPALAVAQGTGCSVGWNQRAATAPNCYIITGSSTQPQRGLAWFLATGQALDLETILPDDYVANTALTFEWAFAHDNDNNTGHTVTWSVDGYGCNATGGSIQPTYISGTTATATAVQGTAGNTSTVTLAITPTGSGLGNCQPGSRLLFRTSLSATTTTLASTGTQSTSHGPMLSRLRLKYLRNPQLQ